MLLLSKYLTLCKNIRLDISIIVLAGPHKGSRRLEHLSDHVINKPVLIPDLQFVKLRLVVPVGSTKTMMLLQTFRPSCTSLKGKKRFIFPPDSIQVITKSKKGDFKKPLSVYKKPETSIQNMSALTSQRYPGRCL